MRDQRTKKKKKKEKYYLFTFICLPLSVYTICLFSLLVQFMCLLFASSASPVVFFGGLFVSFSENVKICLPFPKTRRAFVWPLLKL